MKSKKLKEELIEYLEMLKAKKVNTKRKVNLKFELKAKQLLNNYIKILRKEAYQDNPDSQFELALCYDNGLLGDKFRKYKYWIEKAAKNNHPAACNIYGWIIESESPTSIAKMKKAIIWYKKSAELGDILGKKNLKIAERQILKMGN